MADLLSSYNALPQNGLIAPKTSFGGATMSSPSIFPTTSSTPQTSGNIGASPFGGVLGGALAGVGYISPIKSTPTGGVTFDPTHAPAYTTPSETPSTQQPNQGLSTYVTNTNTTPAGGKLTSSINGNPTGYTPSTGYKIDTSGTVPSSAFAGNVSPNGIGQSQKSYMDYVNALAQAQGYSPDYIQALQQQQGAQSHGSYLQSVGAGLNADLATGNGFTGYSKDAATAQTGIQQNLNTQQEALNTQQQTMAGINLNTAQLKRTGDIASAQSQLQYNPTAVSSENAISQYNSLQQQYPNASIPEYNNALSPALNQQIAQELVANSPAYKAGFTSTYTNAQGGTDVLNKLSLGTLQQNSNGTYSLVNGADKALGDANANIVQNQANIYSNIDSALTSFGKTSQSTIQFANQYGLNQSDIPYINQIQNAIKAKTAPAGALAAFQTDVTNLQNDYAAFLTARNGSVAGTNEEAAKTIDINKLSPAQMQIVFSQMQTDGKNTQAGALSQIQKATQGLQTNQAASSIGSQGSGGLYDF